MATITANTTDGYTASGLKSSWNDAHDATSTQTLNTSATDGSIHWGPRSEYAAARGRYYIVRAFFDWNVSSISGTVSAASIKIKTSGAPTGSPKNIVIKSGHDPSDTSEHWYSTMISGLGITYSGWDENTSGVEALSEATTAANDGFFTTYTLNSAGLTYLNSVTGGSTPFVVAVLNYDYDYLDTAPTDYQKNGIYYANHSTSGNRPYLDYTVSAGYGNNIAGTDSVAKVNGTAVASIEKVIGV